MLSKVGTIVINHWYVSRIVMLAITVSGLLTALFVDCTCMIIN